MKVSWKENNTLKESAPEKQISYLVRTEEPNREVRDIKFVTLKQAQDFKKQYISDLTNYAWLRKAKMMKYNAAPERAEKMLQNFVKEGIKIYRVITNYVEVKDEENLQPSLF